MSMNFPAPTLTTQPFWDGLRNRQFLLQYDPVTRRYQFPPRAISVRTGKQNLEWRKVRGRGVIHAITEARVPAPDYDQPVPYKVVLVELDEGVRIMGRLALDDGQSAEVGSSVEVAFEDTDADTPFFVFRRRGRK